METLITVNVIIADRNYRIKIQPDDEAVLRKTVKIINDKIKEYKQVFAGKDMQDYVAMVLLWLATEQTKSPLPVAEEQTITQSLQQLETLVDGFLNQTQL
ncbi:cell division protein ZapA [Hydrotalea sandarakina]|jgi:cell division protein ZapA|uniref:Cell division protein ZapA n=1 Tax=Hydrotalea sandarakina TaxID=1004304 RepID=A0A2W7RME1_9BACT|nr:cell division protein ZapA [Hydrotalea sandarakina]PZX61431.1 cell division protein ZapA [Hydrotalea sandarakina]